MDKNNKPTCNSCSKSFQRKDNLRRHQLLCGTDTQRNNICGCGAKCFRSDHLRRHQKECSKAIPAAEEQPDRENHEETERQIPEQWQCPYCLEVVNKTEKLGHCKSAAHKDKAQIRAVDGVYKIISCFEDKIVIYRLLNQDLDNLNLGQILELKKRMVKTILQNYVERHAAISFQLEAYTKYVKDDHDEGVTEGTFFINHKYSNLQTADVANDQKFDEIVSEAFKQMCTNSEEIVTRGSGWSLSKIHHVDLHINQKVSLIGGAAFIPLPDHLHKKKACINPVNTDSMCFKWCIKSYFLYEIIKDEFETKLASIGDGPTARYRKQAEYKKLRNRLSRISNDDERMVDEKYEINFDGVTFPMELESISQFLESNPSININVFGISAEDDKNIVGPLFASRRKVSHNINLLYLTDGEGSHFCWIKDLSRLSARQRRNRRDHQHYCNVCLLAFNRLDQLERHNEIDCLGIVTVVPDPGSTLKFESHNKKIKAPFVVYADFECKLEPVDDETNKKHKHVPSSFSYLIKCSFDESLDQVKLYRGDGCGKQFVQNLIKDVKDLYEEHIFNNYIEKDLTDQEEASFLAAKECYICKKPFSSSEDKVRDHCHHTGDYRGPAHNKCNLKYRLNHEVPIFFHNFSKYDAHLFIRELTELESDKNVQIIPSNTETYISVIKSVKLDRTVPSPKRMRTNGSPKEVFLKLIFKDSFRFLSASVDALAKSLQPEDFKNLEKFFPTNAILLKRKGVFPYELVKTDKDYEIETFPDRAAFSSCLNNYDMISVEDYEYAKSVYTSFKCKNLGEYSDLYLKTDVCILADVVEKFREECLDPELYGLDPAHYYTSPGLAWDAMLKVTDCEIELLSDLEMINFIRKGIRGGLSQCSHRKATAHNKYTHPGENISDPSYLMYYDVNNLYGWAMCQKLPAGQYEWLSQDDVQNFNVEHTSADDDYGYILEVDVEYPHDKHLHDYHNDLPFLPEKDARSGKLMATLKNKNNYVVHSVLLKQALEHGLKVTKVHRVLRFRQDDWMRPYIELNNRVRAATDSKTKKDLCKLMNNSVFGEYLA